MSDDYTAVTAPSSQISFGANPLQLQGAAVLSDIATSLQGTFLGNLCQHASDNLSGANMEGMDIIKDCVSDLSYFYGVDNVKVCFEQGEPGVHSTGFTDSPNDNWIGGDPAVLKDYAAEYGTDFVKNVFAHEMGHYVFDQLGLRDKYETVSNEACADFLSGLYAGSKNLDPEGMKAFLEGLPDDPAGDYPSGAERAALFAAGYEVAQDYPWRDFQSILDDGRFDLGQIVREVAEQYAK